MDIFRLFLLYWHIEYQTNLTDDQIGQCLRENVLTGFVVGFTIYTRKPYIGSFTPQGFSVRRVRSRSAPRGSLAPSVTGTYGMRDGKMVVTLSVRPHPILLAIFILFAASAMFFWVLAILEVYQTWDITLAANPSCTLAFVYGLPWLIFRIQCGADLRFWKQALHLQEIVR